MSQKLPYCMRFAKKDTSDGMDKTFNPYNPLRFACNALTASFAAFSAGCDYIRAVRVGEVPGTVYRKPKISHDVSRAEVHLYPGGKGKIIHFIRKEPYYEFNPQQVEVITHVQTDNIDAS